MPPTPRAWRSWLTTFFVWTSTPATSQNLGAGEAPLYEPGLDEVLKSNVDAGRLRFTSSYEEAAEFANLHFIAVATPQKQGEFAADLKYVEAVIETLAPRLTLPTVIFGKSTVPVGTAARLGARGRRSRCGVESRVLA